MNSKIWKNLISLCTVMLAILLTGQSVSSELTMDFRGNAAISYQEIEYRNDEVQLFATLMLPKTQKAMGTVILIHGSGKSSRSNVWAGMVAQLLVSNGMAVVFPDKRGAGDSTGDIRTSSFHDLADDAHAAVQHIRAYPELGAPVEKIGLVGLSQGGRVAPMVASKWPDQIAFVINISGSSSAGYISIRYERENTYREKHVSIEWLLQFRLCDALVDLLLLGQIDFEQYLPCSTRFDDGPYADFAHRIYPDNPNDWRLGFFPQALKFDPIPYWKQTRQPVFVAYGALDELENVPVVLSVDLLNRTFKQSGKSNHEIHVYREVGHGLLLNSHDAHVFSQVFTEDLARWLSQTVE